jgi:dihydroorotate dehydrogenase electron transfer subunit
MKRIEDFTIIENKAVDQGSFILVAQCASRLENIQPGQFVNMQVPDTQHTFLRRPISICTFNKEKNTIKFYIRKVGNGTEKLSALKVGEKVNMVYPLGNGFDTDSKSPLLIGGGCGIAPLVLLAQTFAQKGVRATILLGAKSGNLLSLKEDFAGIADVYISTDDGSMGEKGLVVNHSLLHQVNTFDKIYTCGPTVMMKAVAKLARENNIPCMVSLENTMACGVGACLCCVTKTHEGHKCVCTEGPVFDALELDEFIDE